MRPKARPDQIESFRFIRRHCEERSDEAIQGCSTRVCAVALDCRAASRLAMTMKLACLVVQPDPVAL
jgi:hypothetical protein